jgi:tetratricopeptide (TPR) repeat protein
MNSWYQKTMNKYYFFKHFVLWVPMAMLTACQQAAPPARVAQKIDHNAVLAIRAAGTQFVSDVEVQPLRDPALDGWLKQAHELEAQDKFAEALVATQKALALAPGAPDILQFQAELKIEQSKFAEAAALAQKSYDSGPKVGSLCARNLQTLVEANRALAKTDAAEKAKQLLNSCRVERTSRY